MQCSQGLIGFVTLVSACQPATPVAAAPTPSAPLVVSAAPPASPAAAPSQSAPEPLASAAPAVPALATRVLWTHVSKGEHTSLIHADGERAYVVAGPFEESADHVYVLCLNAKTGDVIWSHDHGSKPFGFGAYVADGVVVLTAFDQGKEKVLAVLDAGKGKRLTRTRAPARPAPAKGRLKCSGPGSELVCSDGETGQERWRVEARHSQLLSQPGGLVCFARAYTYGVECYGADDGKLRWSYAVPGGGPGGGYPDPRRVNFQYEVLDGLLLVAVREKVIGVSVGP